MSHISRYLINGAPTRCRFCGNLFRLRTATSKRGTTDKAHTSATNIAPPRKAVMIDAKAHLALVLPCEILRGRHSQGMSASRWVARSE
jgi:hypothetical protein